MLQAQDNATTFATRRDDWTRANANAVLHELDVALLGWRLTRLDGTAECDAADLVGLAAEKLRLLGIEQ